MELDHVFWMVPSQAAAEKAIHDLWLVETYRRHHPGQGTSNICCCFDNAFVEFLWITNAVEARSPESSRLGLFERSRLDGQGICPFGISWRGVAQGVTPDMWSYAPSYLPAGMKIAVATSSDDHRLPLVFQSPGLNPPIEWPLEKRGALQHGSDFRSILTPELSVPQDLTTDPMLKWLSDTSIINIATSQNNAYSIRIAITDTAGSVVTQLVLPLIPQIDQ
jgi:Glyoxalase-like domain